MIRNFFAGSALLALVACVTPGADNASINTVGDEVVAFKDTSEIVVFQKSDWQRYVVSRDYLVELIGTEKVEISGSPLSGASGFGAYLQIGDSSFFTFCDQFTTWPTACARSNITEDPDIPDERKPDRHLSNSAGVYPGHAPSFLPRCPRDPRCPRR